MAELEIGKFMKTISDMYSMMESCNGEIRVKPGRYGGGWLAAGCCCVEWEFDKQWEDLTGGDLEYFDAVDFFHGHCNAVIVQYAHSPESAFKECEIALTKNM